MLITVLVFTRAWFCVAYFSAHISIFMLIVDFRSLLFPRHLINTTSNGVLCFRFHPPSSLRLHPALPVYDNENWRQSYALPFFGCVSVFLLRASLCCEYQINVPINKATTTTNKYKKSVAVIGNESEVKSIQCSETQKVKPNCELMPACVCCHCVVVWSVRRQQRSNRYTCMFAIKSSQQNVWNTAHNSNGRVDVWVCVSCINCRVPILEGTAKTSTTTNGSSTSTKTATPTFKWSPMQSLAKLVCPVLVHPTTFVHIVALAVDQTQPQSPPRMLLAL